MSSGSHLDQAYLGEEAPNALVASTAQSTTPGGVDATSLVPAPLPAKSNIVIMGLGAGLAAYLLCRALQTKGKSLF